MTYPTIGEIIEYVDGIKLNSFTAQQKTTWINELEYRIQYEIMLLDAESIRDYAYEDIITCRSVQYSEHTVALPKRLRARPGGTISITGKLNDGEYTVEAINGKEIRVEQTLMSGEDTGDVQIIFDGRECQLLVPAPFSEIYYDYLLMKMAEHFEESSEQNNRATTFKAAWTRYAIWFAESYNPSGGQAVFSGYYIKGDTGAPGEMGLKGEKGDKGDAFTYDDFTPEQLSRLKGDTGAKGDKGDNGSAATVTIGTVTTGAAGSAASVVNSGTPNAAVLDFVIPRGTKGDKGDVGSPDDYIVAHGTASGWSWCKWSSGTAECWGRFTRTIAGGYPNSLGGFRYTAAQKIAFPFAFSEQPALIVDGGSSNMMNLVRNFGTTATEAGFVVVGIDASTADLTVQVNIYARGDLANV